MSFVSIDQRINNKLSIIAPSSGFPLHIQSFSFKGLWSKASLNPECLPSLSVIPHTHLHYVEALEAAGWS